MITQKELKELLDYDESTGLFTWRVKTGSARPGNIAGGIKPNKNGKRYVVIRIKRKSYYAHRLAFLWVNGTICNEQIDHIDGNGLNNRFSNLREVSSLENGRNQRLFSTNSSGFAGVMWNTARSKWQSQIKVKGIKMHLGYFKNKSDAINARMRANEQYSFHKSHGIQRPK